MTETLLELIDRLPARGRLEAWWTAPPSELGAHGLPSSALAVFAVWLAMRSRRPVLALVPDPEGSFQEAGAWFREDVRTVVFPAVETLPFDRLAPDEETVRRRLEAVDALGSGEPVVCFTSWTAMTRPTLGADPLHRWSFTLKPAQTYSLGDLQRRLTTLGYRREPLVQGAANSACAVASSTVSHLTGGARCAPSSSATSSNRCGSSRWNRRVRGQHRGARGSFPRPSSSSRRKR